jgi:hypothetical protein
VVGAMGAVTCVIAFFGVVALAWGSWPIAAFVFAASVPQIVASRRLLASSGRRAPRQRALLLSSFVAAYAAVIVGGAFLAPSSL